MNKKIWLTGALCIAAIFITVFIYNNFIMEESETSEPAGTLAGETEAEAEAETKSERPEPSVSQYETEGIERTIEYETDVFTVRFSTAGGVITSLVLNDYEDRKSGNVEMIFSGDSGIYPFSFHPGDFTNPGLGGLYDSRVTDNRVVFTGRFANESGNSFILKKTYTFAPDEYMIRFDLEIETMEGELAIGDGGYLYSLGIGPQLGPEINGFNRGYVYRYFCLRDGDEKRNVAAPEGEQYLALDTPFSWLGVEGRYFTYVTIPVFDNYHPAWDEREIPGLFKQNSYYIRRVDDGAGPLVSDSYYMYFGPKDRKILEAYNNPADNHFGLSEQKLDLLSGQNGIIAGLSSVVEAVLKVLNKVIPNYGINIIIFALLIQVIIYPISRRTYDNSIKMQMLGPEIGTLRKKLKYDKGKLNQEVLKLFEEKGVKPRSSMLPFIIHLPFFILTYVLLLTDIDFRMATFISGWITDVARPEYLVDLSPAVMPITGWDKIRLLPMIVLAVSLIQSRYIQAPEDSIGSMRVMSYLLPIVMFIVIYNMPAGAVLYWLTMTVSNLILQWKIKRSYQLKGF